MVDARLGRKPGSNFIRLMKSGPHGEPKLKPEISAMQTSDNFIVPTTNLSLEKSERTPTASWTSGDAGRMAKRLLRMNSSRRLGKRRPAGCRCERKPGFWLSERGMSRFDCCRPSRYFDLEKLGWQLFGDACE